MQFLNSTDYAPAATNPSDVSFKDTVMDYAKTLDAHDLYSLSGKFGSDIFKATISEEPSGNKAILESVKKEIDALLEEKLTEEANASARRSLSRSEGEDHGAEASQMTDVPPGSGKKKGEIRKSESPPNLPTRRSLRQTAIKKKDYAEDDEEGDHRRTGHEASLRVKTLVIRPPRTPEA